MAKKNELAKTGETKPRPKKGRGGVQNWPNARFTPENDEDRALVSKLLTEALTEYRKPRVKNDEELAQRLDDYFTMCAEKGQTPTVEEMGLSTGFTDNYLWEIEVGKKRGFSPETAFILKKAKNYLKTFDAKLVVAGKLNFLAYCFRAKNYYGMVDKQEVVFAPSVNLGDQSTQEQLQQKYLDDMEIVKEYPEE